VSRTTLLRALLQAVTIWFLHTYLALAHAQGVVDAQHHLQLLTRHWQRWWPRHTSCLLAGLAAAAGLGVILRAAESIVQQIQAALNHGIDQAKSLYQWLHDKAPAACGRTQYDTASYLIDAKL
jgi:protein-S-isoprenylcysteine O-methyltransferase Ste14